MKPLSETYKELGIAFTFPIIIKDSNGNETYHENSYDRWEGCEYYELWYRCEYDANDNLTYHEDSDDFWYRYERDADGNETYYEDSNGKKRGTPRSAKT